MLSILLGEGTVVGSAIEGQLWQYPGDEERGRQVSHEPRPRRFSDELVGVLSPTDLDRGAGLAVSQR